MRIAKNILTLVVVINVLVMFFSACEEDDKTYPIPEIIFTDDSGYVYKDTTLLLSDFVKLGIEAKTNSDVELTHFNYTVIEDDTNFSSIDTGIFTKQFFYTKIVNKGIAYKEEWQFYVRDRDGRKSNVIGVTLTKDSASIFGEISSVESLTFGAQENNTYKGFYSLATENLYSLDEAYNNQGLINLLYFYDFFDGDENTISSPGANIDESVFPGTHGLLNWSTRNTVRFVEQTDISIEEFDACQNDSLILANTFNFQSGKRKAKHLAAGKIFAFVTEIGEKKGLFKVINVEGTDQGFVEIAIKAQK